MNYAVTSNHIHLLVLGGNERDVIPNSIKLIAGRTGQEFNQRKNRKGAFWEDRYHATAIERGDHLLTCLVYIDLNMVRAGVVEWTMSIAVGNRRFVEKVKLLMGALGIGRKSTEAGDSYQLREPAASYKADFGAKKRDIGPENTFSWSVIQ